MAIESYQSQLERVQSAIAAIEGGAQAYEIDGRRLTRGDLRALYEREKYLREMVAQETNGTRAHAAWPGWN